MFNKLRILITTPELRLKIFFIFGVLVVFRFMATIPVPGVDRLQLKSFLGQNQFFGLLNIFSGGVLDNLSIVMLGVGPYITASIIMQLLTMIFPSLKEMYQEEGEAGRARFNQYSRLLAVPLSILQSFGLLTILIRQNVLPQLTPLGFITNIAVVTAGTMILMWLGELITEKGLGNGVSLMIFAGIVSRLPVDSFQAIQQFDIADKTQIISYLAFLAVALFVIAGVVIITEGQRNIPVSYAKRIRGMRVYGGNSTYLPLRVNQAGVIPIIFAVSIILFPGLLGNVLGGLSAGWAQSTSQFLISAFNNTWIYALVYFVLVFAFTYFYTAVTFDPQQIATNIQKQGGFILGILPARPTADYLYRILSRITFAVALFLGVIAILPIIVQNLSGISSFSLGGTSLLIAVSVILETLKQVDAQLVMREYE